MACRTIDGEASKDKYSSGEHLILGDRGYLEACENNQHCDPQILRLDGKKSFTYGELVAFSGDFYATPEEIYTEKEQAFHKFKRNNSDNVKENFKKEVQTIENFLHGHSEERYPDFNLSSAWNFPDYISLSLANAPHFGFYNMQNYIKYHGQALDLAIKARDLSKADPEKGKQLLNQALFTNAFADHFLTDGFASGHIRDPRVQILSWAQQKKISNVTAGTLAKIVHDRDGEIRKSKEHGLNVSNANGDNWFTRCDSQLFWNNNMEDESIQIPIKAVKASVREVLNAFQTGLQKKGIFAATQFVPFPRKGGRQLIELFPATLLESDYDKIIEGMAIYTRIKIFSGIDKSVLKQFTKDLPEIMQAFRDDVVAMIGKDPELSGRLPPAYLKAFSDIR